MTRATWIAILVLCICATVPAAAAPAGWGLRLGRQASSGGHDFTYEYFGSTSHVDYLDAGGWDLGVEARPWQRFSIEGGWSRLEWHTQTYTTPPPELPHEPFIVQHANTDMDTLSVTGLFHPLVTRHMDGYVGPLLGWTLYEAQGHEADLTYGLRLGIEFAIGSTPLRLGAEVRRLQLAHSATDDRDIYGSFHADTAALTIGYRFR